ncbi:ABC transporter permease [Streptomyces sp. NPDC050560]|uniref:ABC transporter permease n=1 Tax=Streptomyces sp. NPDC050560 TaxID=3365630 RepID=UPI0037AF6FFE
MLTATSSAVDDEDIPPAVARRKAKRARRNLRESGLVMGLRLLVVVVVLVLWQVMSGPVLPEYAVSRPTDVAQAVWDLLTSAEGWTNIETTTVEVAAGFVIGVAIGSVMGVLLGTFPLAGRVLEPLAAALNGIPKIAVAPLFVLFFGLGEWSKIAIAVTGVAFIMFYNLYLGLRMVDRELTEIIRVMGGRSRHVLSYVTLPTLAPPFFAGLKAGGPLAILGVIGGEFIASFNGLGHLLFTDAMALNSSGVFAGLIVLMAMSLILNSILTQLDKFVLRRLGLGDRVAQAQA